MLFYFLLWIHNVTGRACANILAKDELRARRQEQAGVHRWGCWW